MKKITMNEASKMCRPQVGSQGLFHLMHIEWFTANTGYSHVHGMDLAQDYPDCSNVVVNGKLHWRESGAVVAVVLDNEFQKEVKEKWEQLEDIEQILKLHDSSI